MHTERDAEERVDVGRGIRPGRQVCFDVCNWHSKCFDAGEALECFDADEALVGLGSNRNLCRLHVVHEVVPPHSIKEL